MRGGLDLPSGGVTIAPQHILPLDDRDNVTVESLAKMLTGIELIGTARNALEKAGMHATIAGNRITVNDEFFAQFVGAITRPTGRIEARWVIYGVTGASPVWIVGAEQ